jgi:hypothetical protein
LLLACGIGFGFGELTRHSTPTCPETNGPPAGAETTPLKKALDLMLSARRLYVSLAPLVWIAASWQPAKADGEGVVNPNNGSCADPKSDCPEFVEGGTDGGAAP